MENKKIKVISFKNLPGRLPIHPSVTAYLALEYWKADQLIYGIVGTLFVFLWIYAIQRIITQKEFDVFKTQN